MRKARWERGSRLETFITSNAKGGFKVARQEGVLRRLVGRTRVAGSWVEARSITQLGRGGVRRSLIRWELRWVSKVCRCGTLLRPSYHLRREHPQSRTLRHF